MSKSTKFIVFAWIGIPIVFLAFVFIAYKRALAIGLLPFVGSREWIWWVGYFGSIVVGTYCVARAHAFNGSRWIIRVVSYVLVMSAGLGLVHLVVACGSGDCM